MVQGITKEKRFRIQEGGRNVLFNDNIIASILDGLVTAAAAVLEPVTGYFAIALLYLST